MPEALWAQYGIAGASLAVLWFAIRQLVGRNDAADARHTDERDKLVQMHREERAEWKASDDRRQDRSNAVVEKLSEAIREMKH